MEPLKIGPLILPHRAVFGPMAGFTDAPCRRLMAQHGAGFTVSEMVSSRALVYHDHKTVGLLRAQPNGAPYGVQLFGEVPEIMGEAAAAIEEYEFDFIDINMGCPAPKIVSGGAGSKLMLDPDLCGRIVEQVKAHTSRPVTVKLRKGWDAQHITAVECARACEQAGAAAIAVHARTREQMYTPGIDPEIIAEVKQAVGVPVFGNGDIHTAQDAVELVQRTGCDGVMVARGALGDPWLFERINAALEGRPEPKTPNLQARMNAMRRQVEEMVEQKGEFVAMPQARAQTMHYMKGLKGAAGLRRICCELERLEDIDRLIEAVFDQQRRAADPDDVREVPFP
ncbi:MAG: tRNA dihydrouridine synthase DusB [Faecalibacterium sp.]